MPKKLTLEMKKQISKEVTAETKRCLGIIRQVLERNKQGKDGDATFLDLQSDLKYTAIKQIIDGCPYLEFNPGLKKLIPRN
jgi:hypothetical protein